MTDESASNVAGAGAPGQRERDLVVALLLEQDPELARPSAPIDLSGGLRWTPDLVGPGSVVHVELDQHPSKAFSRRLRAAAAAGVQVVVATPTGVVTVATLELLQEIEASPVELHEDEAGWHATKWRSVADWVAMANMALRPDELRRLVGRCLDVAEDADRTNHARGDAYEQALCLVFSQVSWLKVTEHAFNNETEEIDIALVVTGVGEYAQLAKGPIAIATAKNEKKSLSSATIKYLQVQMANRRGRCKLGFACALGTLSRSAKGEILRTSQTETLIVPLDGDRLQQLLDDADRLDQCLIEMVIEATTA